MIRRESLSEVTASIRSHQDGGHDSETRLLEEGSRLIRAFLKIKNADLRHALVTLVENIADGEIELKITVGD